MAVATFALCSYAHSAGRAGEPPRRLPPVFLQEPVPLVPPDVLPTVVDSNVAAFPEQLPPSGTSLLAPEAPAVQLISRAEPVRDVALKFQHLRVAEAPEPPATEEPSPFNDDPQEPPKPEMPDDLKAPGDTAQPEAVPKPTEDSATKPKDGEPQKFGQEPVNYSLQFLRTQDVLLNEGDWQFDTGFAYTLFDNDFPISIIDGGGNVVGVVEGHLRDRLVYSPLAVRYGWSKNVQLFGVLPTGISDTQFSTIGDSTSLTTGGIGDLTAGASFHLLAGCGTLPDVVSTLAVTAPTGDFNAPVGSVIPGTALGQGFWAFSAQLLFINRYDPVICFYGVGYRHLFEREFEGLLFQPGEQLNYQFGVGFAINDRVTLSAAFLGFYITNTLVDRSALLGTNVEPLSLRFAATIARNERIIEPFAQIGMTDFAPRASIGITVTFY